jgi:hypothetical protein
MISNKTVNIYVDVTSTHSCLRLPRAAGADKVAWTPTPFVNSASTVLRMQGNASATRVGDINSSGKSTNIPTLSSIYKVLTPLSVPAEGMSRVDTDGQTMSMTLMMEPTSRIVICSSLHA